MTIFARGALHKARASIYDVEDNTIYVDYPAYHTAVVCKADIGITWCYGWKGEAVDALRAAAGMSPSTPEDARPA